jgi:hypothetical protein
MAVVSRPRCATDHSLREVSNLGISDFVDPEIATRRLGRLFVSTLKVGCHGWLVQQCLNAGGQASSGTRRLGVDSPFAFLVQLSCTVKRVQMNMLFEHSPAAA